MQPNSFPFYKLQATGNDFIFIKASDLPSDILLSEKIPQWCHRQKGIGADGVAIVEFLGSQKLQWSFYNSDGEEANMCGNAARCAVEFAQKIFHLEGEVSLETRVGPVTGSLISGHNKKISYFTKPSVIRKVDSAFDKKFPTAYFVNVGVPHAVIPVDEAWAIQSQAKELSALTRHQEFGSGGGNLTFVSWPKAGASITQAVTLERGVNDFTLSCGTGVIATALVHHHLLGSNELVSVEMPGGLLKAKYNLANGQCQLEGPAELIFRGVYEAI